MTEKSIDLKKLLYLIDDNKDVETNLIMDEGCIIEADDPKPLVKIINYCLNYLSQISDAAIEIGLDLRSTDYLLTMMAYTDKSEMPEVSDKIQEALNNYKGTVEFVHEQGKFAQFKITFQK